MFLNLCFSAAVPERRVRAEDPVPGANDGRAVSRQPAGAGDDHDARGEGRRTRAAAHHRAPSLRHLTRTAAAFL